MGYFYFKTGMLLFSYFVFFSYHIFDIIFINELFHELKFILNFPNSTKLYMKNEYNKPVYGLLSSKNRITIQKLIQTLVK